MEIQKITPFLWFESGAEEAAKFYVSIFKNSRIVQVNPMGTTFILEGLNISILNGGPAFKLNEAFSFSVSCENQEEIDYFWEKLSEGGNESRCGWLKDKFGVSWQVVPSILSKLLADPSKAKNVINAFMQMKKFDIEKLLNA